MRNQELNYGLGAFAWEVAWLYRVGGLMGVVFGVSAAVLSYQIRSMGDRHEAPAAETPKENVSKLYVFPIQEDGAWAVHVATASAATGREPGSEYFLG